MTEHTLPRTGKPPLHFRGELVAESDGERQAGRDWSRWHELAVYRTEGGQYVVRIAYRTRYQGELEWDGAWVIPEDRAGVADAAALVAERFSSHDPGAVVKGYPPGEIYAERQARLLEDVRSRYLAQVSEVLSSGEFAEEIR